MSLFAKHASENTQIHMDGLAHRVFMELVLDFCWFDLLDWLLFVWCCKCTFCIITSSVFHFVFVWKFYFIQTQREKKLVFFCLLLEVNIHGSKLSCHTIVFLKLFFGLYLIGQWRVTGKWGERMGRTCSKGPKPELNLGRCVHGRPLNQLS